MVLILLAVAILFVLASVVVSCAGDDVVVAVVAVESAVGSSIIGIGGVNDNGSFPCCFFAKSHN